jgi:urocanate hydratase
MDEVIRKGLSWDVMGGVARRNWAGNENALQTVKDWNAKNKEKGHITEPYIVSDDFIEKIIEQSE